MTTERIVLGIAEDPGEVLRALFALAAEQELDPRVIVWVGEEKAVDVPTELAEAYTGGTDKPKKPRKAAKATPPPPPDKEE